MLPSRHCFYCGVRLTSRPFSHSPHLGTDFTRDHVYPQYTHRDNGKDLRWQQANVVACCGACNVYKGHLHPLDWLVIMPNNARATKFAELLVKLGEDMPEVFDALRRRKR